MPWSLNIAMKTNLYGAVVSTMLYCRNHKHNNSLLYAYGRNIHVHVLRHISNRIEDKRKVDIDQIRSWQLSTIVTILRGLLLNGFNSIQEEGSIQYSNHISPDCQYHRKHHKCSS